MAKRRDRSHKSKPTSLFSLVEVELNKFTSCSSQLPIPLALRQAWEPAVGSRVAMRAIPTRLVNETLYVRVTSSAWMTELQLLAPSILHKLRDLSGVERLSELRFTLGKLPQKLRSDDRASHEKPPPTDEISAKVFEALQQVTNPDLRAQIEAAVRKNYRE